MIGCETKEGEAFIDICYPNILCEGLGGQNCKYPSNLILDSEEESSKKCQDPNMNTTTPSCEEGCHYQQINNYYPVWNGECVNVNCPISNDIQKIYNIPYNKCSSSKEDCGISNLKCNEEEYIVPNRLRKLFCKAPSKIKDSTEKENQKTIHSGCSENPLIETEAEAEAKRKEDRTRNILLEAGLTPTNITKQDLRGTTLEQQIDLETSLEETRQMTEEGAQQSLK